MNLLARVKRALAPRLDRPPAAAVRDTDWRFLLPNPDGRPWEHLVLLGGSNDLARTLVEMEIARRVSCDVPSHPCADVVVILRGWRSSLDRAVSCLAPGGSLYAETRRRPGASAFSPAGADRLRRFGLSEVRAHWIWPSAERREAYLPLDAPQAIAWYAENVVLQRTLRRRLSAARLHLAARTGSGLRAPLARDYAITAVCGASPAVPSLLGHPDLRRRGFSSGTRVMVLTGGEPREVYRRVALLPFRPAASEPELVLKLWRTPDKNPDAQNEQATLAAIQSSLADSRLIPPPLGLLPWGTLQAGAEGFCRGRSLASSSSRWGRSGRRKARDLEVAISGLADLYASMRVRCEPWSAREASERLERPIRRYEQELPTGADERRLFARVLDRSRELIGSPMPIVWSHPDLGPSNVLIRADGVSVIDWAKAAPGLPMQDVLYFAQISSLDVSRARGEVARLDVMRRLFLEPECDRLALGVRRGIERCLQALELDRRFLPMLLVLLWVNRSLGRVDRQRAVGRGEGTNPKSGNPYPSYVRLLAEHSNALFRTSTAESGGSGRSSVGARSHAFSR
jgi:hypothetical protein